ncbi:Gfo/Idh/MocA family protein [Edaphobacter modestus]|uniref:1,5-anhydro-D-fructose reductase (1,5-anhydro-D-mannitol-forming) n=1 Tax=Edaphobacter modestus TaxID=388466 RepID=A0A4Q7YY06_9BACT|nr:Gfo/Idh/MocA family oxidoreductase [Edaphobacter modestus]RZU42121.1 1,5-anhydro-D-fructose reductase (1,5-anhydro-D-mannitol-forming) [Edaphobacter modestus]
MAAPVRFAILGFGLHAVRRLLPAFAPSERTRLVGMWRRDQNAAKQNCIEHKIAHCFTSPEELCASPDVDAVFITSPDAMHYADTLMALRYGKAVLCEKPVAMNAAQAREMVDASKTTGALYGVAQNFRYNHSLDWVRKQIQAGKIGRPQIARAEFDYPANHAPRKWIMDPTLACGGPIGDVGVHCIDALRYVLGEEVESISTLATKTHPEDQVEATAMLQMQMTGGVLASVGVSARSPYRTLVEITGSDGVLIAENGLTVDRPIEMVLRRAGEVVETATADNADAYTRMLDAFADAMQGGEPFAATGEDGVRNMMALDAAFRSWKTGQRETIG